MDNTSRKTVSGPAAETSGAIENLDLTPAGLVNTPAQQEDPESIVYTGNS